jgi:glycosyltransferase involved in cell wall biosynthesis
MESNSKMSLELPPAPQDRTGWPWTEATPPLPPTMPNGSPWPKISIVTPSYNQAQFIEETIRSVLLQGYPNLEYIIIDGGSTDGSVEIIKKYEPWLTCWVSEPDRGQSHAINKGFKRSTGDIIAWINSDDYYTKEALKQAALGMDNYPKAGLIHGDGFYCSEDGKIIGRQVEKQVDLARLLWYRPLVQPSIFFKRKSLEAVGELREDLYYRMDFDISIRTAVFFPIQYINFSFSCLRIWPGQKTHDNNISAQFDEEINVRETIYKVYSAKNLTVRKIGLDALSSNLIRASICCYANFDCNNGYRFIDKLALSQRRANKIPIDSIWLGLVYSGLLDRTHSYQDVNDVIENVMRAVNIASFNTLLKKIMMRVRVYKAIQLNLRSDVDKVKVIVPTLLLYDTKWMLRISTLKYLARIFLLGFQTGGK